MVTRALERGVELERARGLDWLYLQALRGALRYPALVILLGVVILGGTVAAFIAGNAGVEFFPDVEPERAQVQIHARGNMSVAERHELVGRVEAEILAVNAAGKEIRSVYSVTKADIQGIADWLKNRGNSAPVAVSLTACTAAGRVVGQQQRAEQLDHHGDSGAMFVPPTFRMTSPTARLADPAAVCNAVVATDADFELE